MPRGRSQRETVLDLGVEIQGELVSVPAVDRLDRHLGWQRVDVGDARLHVEEEGVGPPLVLLHGGPGATHHYFHPEFSRAAAWARVIYYDQRGTGLSDYVRGDGYTVAQSVADLDRLRSALGLERWFVLGHSYGGALAQLYALTHTARVAGLILVGSAPPLGLAIGTRQYQFISEAERDRIEQIYHLGGVRVVPSHNAHLNQEDLTNRIYNAFLNGDWKRQQFYKPTRAEMAIIARYEWVHDLGYAEEMVADSSRIDLIGRFQRVGMRTLIMEGAHDLVFDADKPTRFAAEHPRAELVVLDQGGHFPFKDDPDAFFAALRRFMLD